MTRWKISGRLLLPSSWLSVLLGVVPLFAIGCDAARIATFSECMNPPTNPGNPYFKPLAVDAKFGSSQPYTLSLQVYGNVTSGGSLKASYGDAETTLKRTVNVLSYTPYSNFSEFCLSARPGCPLKPAPGNDTSDLSILPSFTFSHEMQSSYAFSTFSTNFRIILSDNPHIDAGCIDISVTPCLGMGLSSVLSFIPLGILVMSGIATIVAAIFNPWTGTADVFEWSSNYGRDVDMLRLVTPGFADCLQYIQFAVFTSALSLNYPGFFQPAVSQASWSILMFSMGPVSGSSQSRLFDNVYTPDATYGLESFSQLVGVGSAEDIWAAFMIIFAAILGGVVAGVIVMGFFRWVLKLAKVFESGDLRNKNIPFLGGMVIRMVYNYMLLPLLSLSAFQLVIAKNSPASVVAVAAVVLFLFVVVTYFLLRKISLYKPRTPLYDELPTLLLYGPLYNTYDEAATLFCVVYVLINVLRAIAIGFIQASGIAQLTLLAICEVVMILALNAFRPYDPKTSMNLYQTFFSIIRLLTVLFQIAFIPSLGIGDAERGWVGYVILVMHGVVLVFGFFMNSVQTVVEVGARQLGAGESESGATRGALAKVFGKRQLSRRTNRRDTVHRPISHASFGNSGGIPLSHDDPHRSGSMASPALNPPVAYGNSSAVLLDGGHVQGSGSENGMGPEPSPGFGPTIRHTHTGSGSTGYTPNTPGANSNFSYFGGTAAAAGVAGAVANRPGGLAVPGGGLAEGNPYYRPPRQNRTEPPSTFQSRSAGGSVASNDFLGSNPRRHSQLSNVSAGEIGRAFGGDDGGLSTRATSMLSDPRRGRTDYYAVREVDQYYRPGEDGELVEEPLEDQPVGHEPLSNQPGRKLGTGPADPTGPVSTVRSWFLGRFGKPKKEESKGFEVVGRRRRPPPMMQRSMPPAGGSVAGDEPPNTAMEMVDRDRANMEEGAVRTVGERASPYDGSDSESQYSDEDDDDDGVGTPRPNSRITELPPVLPGIDAGGDIELGRDLSRRSTKRSNQSVPPSVPRKSSRRKRRPPAPITTSPPSRAYNLLPSQTPESLGVQAYDPPVHMNTSAHRLPFTSSTPPQVGGNRESSYSVADSFLSPDKRSGTADSDSNRPASVGNVQRRLVEDFIRTSDDRFIGLGSQAELVEGINSQGSSATPSDVSGNVRKRSPSNRDQEPHAL